MKALAPAVRTVSDVLRRAHNVDIAQRHPLRVAAPLRGMAIARVVRQNPPHHDGREAEELCRSFQSTCCWPISRK
jgi:hypothetical protein